MPKTIRIITFDEETGRAFSRYTDDDGTVFEASITVSLPDDSLILIDTDYILDFLGEHWPSLDLETERGKGSSNFSAGLTLIGVDRDVTTRVPPERGGTR